VPCAVLAVLSFRSLGREEAFLEKRLAQGLDAELTYAVAVVRENLGRLEEGLAASAPAEPGRDPQAPLTAWRKAVPLVGVPFLLAPDFRILWPVPSSSLSEADIAFLNWNREFISDAAAIPYYQNAALLYKDQLSGQSGAAKPETDKAGGQASAADEKKAEPLKAAAPPAAPISRPGLLKRSEPAAAKGGEVAASKSKIEDVRAEQQALSEFEQSDAARKRVYDEAARMGQTAATRNVQPSLRRRRRHRRPGPSPSTSRSRAASARSPPAASRVSSPASSGRSSAGCSGSGCLRGGSSAVFWMTGKPRPACWSGSPTSIPRPAS
jgi:hypothetical protein